MSRTNQTSISRIRHDDIRLDHPLFDVDDAELLRAVARCKGGDE